MFTGIVECLGKIKSNSPTFDGTLVSVTAESIAKTLKLGDSVAINGACQTVVSFFSGGFEVQASRETLKKTNIGDLKPGEYVNLEAPLKLSTPLGGHLVLGHVDGRGTIKNIAPDGFAKSFVISCEKEICDYIAQKGSITVDGVSLTIADIKDSEFSISVIPHTIKNTNLQFRRIGDKLNLEADIIGKYVVGFMNKNKEIKKKKEDLSLEFLKRAGLA